MIVQRTVLSFGRLGRCEWDWCAIEIASLWYTRKLEDRGGDIRVRCYEIDSLALRDSWTADHERDIDVLLVGAAFTGWKTVLRHMEAIV